MDEIKYTSFIKGKSKWMQECGIPVVAALEPVLESADVEYADVPNEGALFVDTRPTADATLLGAFIGVILFVGSWAATKILDVLFDQKLKPKIEEALNKSNAEAASTQHSLHVYVMCVEWTDLDCLVVVAVKGHQMSDVARDIGLVSRAHRSGLEWRLANSVSKPVIFYSIENGKASETPKEYDTLDVALRKLGT